MKRLLLFQLFFAGVLGGLSLSWGKTTLAGGDSTLVRYVSDLSALSSVYQRKASSRRALGDWDYASVEAMITYHKNISSKLLARSGIDVVMEATHRGLYGTSLDYDKVNKALDKYSNAFDIIDAVIKSLSLVGNVSTTYQYVLKRLQEYKDLMETYEKYCLEHGNILASDYFILDVTRKTINRIGTIGNILIEKGLQFVSFTTGAQHCTTKQYIECVDSLNGCLDEIRKVLCDACFQLRRYLFMRTHYFKVDLLVEHDKRTVCQTAIDAWRERAVEAIK